LPVVFVCGLLEGVFPHASQPDPLLGEALRSAFAPSRHRRPHALRARREERFLFDVALTRATAELILSLSAPQRRRRAHARGLRAGPHSGSADRAAAGV